MKADLTINADVSLGDLLYISLLPARLRCKSLFGPDFYPVLVDFEKGPAQTIQDLHDSSKSMLRVNHKLSSSG